MASTEAPPIERLEVDPTTLGKALVGIGHAFPIGVHSDQKAELDKELDRARVRQRQGMDYLAAHDCIRQANRIFGYGRWGHRVVELVELAAIEVKKDSKTGWHVGYRCTVELTVAGCVPVSGVGYGDGVEYTPAARVRACELAVKEAESDALKRALRNFGDQFGLILYAKEDEQRRITADKAQEQQAEAMKATDAEIEEVKTLASKVSPQAREKTDAAIKQHRDKNETERGLGPIVNREWLTKLSDALVKQAAQANAVAAGEQARAEPSRTFPVPDGVLPESMVTDATPADDADVASAFNA